MLAATPLDVRRPLLAAAAALFLTLSAGPASAAAGPAQLPCVAGVTCQPKPKCANAGVEPNGSNLAAMRRATLCLLNRQRTRHGLRKLRANRPLRHVAQRYARTMVAKTFFDHVSPSGSTFVQRIERSRYLKGFRGYSLGENLAWGGGVLATPRRIVRAWMDSPGHRANILNGSYRDLGVGIVIGVPVAGGGSGATYVNEFGSRAR
jgi:uncharacterized protein YkwD